MFGLLGNLFCKPISIEVRYLIEAIDADEVEYIENQKYGMDAVCYNGKIVLAYLVNGYSGYTVDIDGLEDCLPYHESKKVYRAMVDYFRRRDLALSCKHSAKMKEEVKQRLSSLQ